MKIMEFLFIPKDIDSGYSLDGNTIFLKRLADLEHELTELSLMQIIEKICGLNYFKSWPIPHILTQLSLRR